jgi:sulfane dehydrogenase subunit SoxC
MKPKQPNRRQFLKNGAALAGLTVGASAVARSLSAESTEERIDIVHKYGERSRFVNSVRTGSIFNPERVVPSEHWKFGYATPLQDSAGMVTPNSLHFISSHGYEAPDINPQEHRLLIHGMVDRPLILTIDDLKRMPAMSRFYFIECKANSATGGSGGFDRISPEGTVQDTHGFTSCCEWTGVPLSGLLKEAGMQKSGTWITAEGDDTNKFSKSIPIEKALDDALVAYAQNGEPLRPEQGYPLRLVTPGWQGINNVKWLRRIDVVDEPYMAMDEVTKYPRFMPDGLSRWFEFELGPKSVITRPSGGQHLPTQGFYEITGLAWSGGGAVRKVEVSADGGKTWKDAQLHGPILAKAHTRFSIPWNWNGEEAMLQSRCTDDKGVVQPTLTEVAKLWGADMDFFRNTYLGSTDINAIQPWKVNRDGSVRNAIF